MAGISTSASPSIGHSQMAGSSGTSFSSLLGVLGKNQFVGFEFGVLIYFILMIF